MASSDLWLGSAPAAGRGCLMPRPLGCTLPCYNRSQRHVAGAHYRRAGHNDARLLYHPQLFSSGDVVLDVGSWEGNDIVRFLQKRPPDVHIHAYEPIPSIRQRLTRRMASFPSVTVHPYGLVGGRNRTSCFVGTGQDAHEVGPGACRDRSELVDVRHAIESHDRVALLHVNCEGCELGLIARLAELPALDRVRAIEMQAHHRVIYKNGLGDDEYCALERHLARRGFELAYRFAFIWEVRRRRDGPTSAAARPPWSTGTPLPCQLPLPPSPHSALFGPTARVPMPLCAAGVGSRRRRRPRSSRLGQGTGGAELAPEPGSPRRVGERQGLRTWR